MWQHRNMLNKLNAPQKPPHSFPLTCSIQPEAKSMPSHPPPPPQYFLEQRGLSWQMRTLLQG